MLTLDANEAVTSVANQTNEVTVLYPITPSSPMGEAVRWNNGLVWAVKPLAGSSGV
jgi:pyruvate/2-oxoacid:ferredoxin oxidoreductase alpha subunit